MLTGFKKLKNVTMPMLKLIENEPAYVKILTPLTVSPELKTRDGKKIESDKKPPELLDVINLKTGESMRLIANAVLAGLLESNYPDHTYVGHSFEFIREAMKEVAGGKRYALFTITEIDAETGGETPVEAKAPQRLGSHKA